MKPAPRNTARLFGLALSGAALALACSVASAEDAAMPPGAKGEILMWIQDAESKLIQLADAMPQNKYAWRPGKGVRSVGEVYMHVATANYGLPTFVGVAPPAGFDFQTFEKSQTTKADISRTLKESFAHMKGALTNATDEDMEKPAEFFGMKTTRRGAFLLLLSHAHEHLGQSIAYARMNGVVPPWTAKEEMAAAAKAKAKDKKRD